ncbi:DUF4231 domain-containing protein [Mycoplasmopsis columbina]|uniref:DUF4231 domain-containing protein n=1 Tax=Mycoplasmopsis columbina TaxID=114881 RepID=UPI0004A6E5E1|nr:DUF4231 domain-containing protein [Mycoplasmopsis columbina]VEU76936.1 Uncharacterised protein [Mycoplasmopsis columbina]
MKLKSIEEFYEQSVKKIKNQIIIYGILYYTFNVIILLLTLFTGVIATIFLAGNSTQLDPNPYKTWLNESTNYIITITVVNSLTALITGILSFFVVNTKYQEKIAQLNKLKFEKIVFLNKQGHYKDLDKNIQLHIFYKRILLFLNVDRFRQEHLIELQMNSLKGE